MNSVTAPTIVKFATLSLVVHAVAFVSWSTPLMPKPQVSAVLSVGFAAPTAVPAKSAATASPAKTKPKASAWRPVRKETVPKRDRARPLAAAPQHRAPVLKPPTPPERTATTPPSVRKRAIATRTVRPADVRVAKASAREDPAVSTRRSVTEVGTPVLSRPWEAVWGSVRSYTPKQPLATANAPVHQHAAPASPIEDKAGERARARIRGRLETDLSRYFSYPPVARKQGWQGHVSVEFTVQPDGQLTNVRVTRSSGYHVLDQSALAALRKVGHLAEARQWLNGQSITVELPVIYRLEN